MELKNADPEDLNDILYSIGQSFNISYEPLELIHIKTFGEMCDHITNKIKLTHKNSCTTQQGFYKLRSTFASILKVDKNLITPKTPIKDILPRSKRKSIIRHIESNMGIGFSLLRPRFFVSCSLFILLFLSLIALFFSWKIALFGIGLSIASLWITFSTGIELDLETFGQLTQQVVRENYIKSRRDSSTFNRNEIQKVIVDWFSYYLDIEESRLTREARFAENEFY